MRDSAGYKELFFQSPLKFLYHNDRTDRDTVVWASRMVHSHSDRPQQGQLEHTDLEQSRPQQPDTQQTDAQRNDSQQNTESAILRVLHVPELLEAILKELDPRVLLRCMRVNRLFLKPIMSPPALRRALLLQSPSEWQNSWMSFNPFAKLHLVNAHAKRVSAHHQLSGSQQVPSLKDAESAASRTLNTVELAEAILKELDPSTLLQCLRLNRFFQTTIKSSPTLRHALWLDSSSLVNSPANGAWLEVNPLFRPIIGGVSTVPYYGFWFNDEVYSKLRIFFGDDGRTVKTGLWREMLVFKAQPRVRGHLTLAGVPHMITWLKLDEPITMGELVDDLFALRVAPLLPPSLRGRVDLAPKVLKLWR